MQLSKSQIKSLVDTLLLKINNGEFTIVKRDKNNLFMIEYRLNKEKLKTMVLSKISEDNFVSEEFDYDTIKYGAENVAIFIIECNLINFNGEQKDLKVYVKIKEKIDYLITISVHEEER